MFYWSPGLTTGDVRGNSPKDVCTTLYYSQKIHFIFLLVAHHEHAHDCFRIQKDKKTKHRCLPLCKDVKAEGDSSTILSWLSPFFFFGNHPNIKLLLLSTVLLEVTWYTVLTDMTTTCDNTVMSWARLPLHGKYCGVFYDVDNCVEKKNKVRKYVLFITQLLWRCTVYAWIIIISISTV